MLSLEKQVCNEKLSQRLKELGVPQKSLFYYAGYDLYISTHNEVVINLGTNELSSFNYISDGYNDFCSAFTPTEISLMLPETIKKEDEFEAEGIIERYFLIISKTKDIFEVEYSCGEYDKCNTEDSNLANALAKMLIYLLENKLINLEDIK